MSPRRLIVLASIATLALAGCQSSPETTGAPPPPPFAVGTQATMNGRTKGVVVPVLNVWTAVPPSEAACTLQHGTLVTITDQQYYPHDSRWFLKIDNGGGCAGWVPETSLAK
jgi:uncharacterized lipoprotein YajG